MPRFVNAIEEMTCEISYEGRTFRVDGDALILNRALAPTAELVGSNAVRIPSGVPHVSAPALGLALDFSRLQHVMEGADGGRGLKELMHAAEYLDNAPLRDTSASAMARLVSASDAQGIRRLCGGGEPHVTRETRTKVLWRLVEMEVAPHRYRVSQLLRLAEDPEDGIVQSGFVPLPDAALKDVFRRLDKRDAMRAFLCASQLVAEAYLSDAVEFEVAWLLHNESVFRAFEHATAQKDLRSMRRLLAEYGFAVWADNMNYAGEAARVAVMQDDWVLFDTVISTMQDRRYQVVTDNEAFGDIVFKIAERGDAKLMKKFIETSAWTVFNSASGMFKNVALLKALAASARSAPASGRTHEVLRYLVAVSSYNPKHVLVQAVKARCSVETIRFLLDEFGGPSSDALIVAASEGLYDAAVLLLEHESADPHANGERALVEALASRFGKVGNIRDLPERLFEKRPDVSQAIATAVRDASEFIALHLDHRRASVTMLRVILHLIERGGTLNAPDQRTLSMVTMPFKKLIKSYGKVPARALPARAAADAQIAKAMADGDSRRAAELASGSPSQAVFDAFRREFKEGRWSSQFETNQNDQNKK